MFRERLRDWWRGYSDADRESVRQKLTPISPQDAGKITWVTHAEMEAIRDLANVEIEAGVRGREQIARSQ